MRSVSLVSLFGIGARDRAAPRDPQATIELDPRGASMCLKRHQHLQFRGVRGWTLRAIGGALWITQDGDRKDTVLAPGESLFIERNEPVVIGALADGGVTLARDAVPRHARAVAGVAWKRLLAPWPQVATLLA
jgi:hypothetical protein